MSKYKEVVQLYLEDPSLSERQIALRAHVSRKTAGEAVKAMETHPFSGLTEVNAMTETAVRQHLFPEEVKAARRREPNYAMIHEELKKPGVTLRTLWREYLAEEPAEGEEDIRPYGYSMFCRRYQALQEQTGLTAPLIHKPGQEIMVDWAGKPMLVTDPRTGRKQKRFLFVGVLPYSMYGYVEAFPNMKEPSWISGHVHMFEYFGGCTPVLIPDNLRTGVTENPPDAEAVINPTYAEMAHHYGAAVVPARPYRPKDKGGVESTVNVFTQSIVGRLRNEEFTDDAALREAVMRACETVNTMPFQKRAGTRRMCFEADERALLIPLPATPYRFPDWCERTVQKNCHIQWNSHYYSVPYQLAGKKVRVRTGDGTVQIWYDSAPICAHLQADSSSPLYVTVEAHMPPAHQAVRGYSPESFLARAQAEGPAVRAVVNRLFDNAQVPQQAYKTATFILQLPKKYPGVSLDDACQEVLRTYRQLSAKKIEQVMARNQQEKKQAGNTSGQPAHALVRGASYFSAQSKGGSSK